jgi:hypothetical protein
VKRIGRNKMAWGCGNRKRSTGTVSINRLNTYDMVSDPGFSGAYMVPSGATCREVLERWRDLESGYTPPKPRPPKPPKVNPHPDIDPYGEENWDEDEQDGYQTHFNNILPIVRNVAARTIGLDLVSVVPMRAPNFCYSNFIYGNEPIKKEPKGQVFCELDPYGEEDWDN